jgi:glycosyltransferase involved in cell wall biosynthesis
VVIPSFNSEKYIQETIQSCLNQTWKNIEIIIVDDGSTDNSYKVAKSFESTNLLVIAQANNGGCAARNRGTQMSQGDYIQYLDADDLLAPNKIEEQMKILLNSNKFCLASGPFAFFIDNTSTAQFIPDDGWKDYSKPIEWLIESLYNKVMFPVQVWLTSRELIDRAGKWNEEIQYLVDNEFFSRVILNSNKMVFIPNAKSFYRKGHLSASHRSDIVGLRSRFKSKLFVTQNLLNIENSPRTRQGSATHLHHFAFGIYPVEIGLYKEVESQIKRLNVPIDKNIAQGKSKVLGEILGWKAVKWIRYFYYCLLKVQQIFLLR